MKNVSIIEKFKNIENLILLLLWTLSASTFTTALLRHYTLYNSDDIGLVGLVMVTTIFILKLQKKTEALLLLLVFGALNLVTFVYFFNFVFKFGFSIFVSPGIQLLSWVCLLILIFRRKDKTIGIVRYLFGETDGEQHNMAERQKLNFKARFSSLSDQEIQDDLHSHAKQALEEIKKERKRSQFIRDF